MDIFISSVGRDLKDARRKVIEQVLKAGDRPIAMEYFTAGAEPPLEECLAKVEEADLVLVILGPSYGSVHPGTGLSFTENEFRHAEKLGIDTLVFPIVDLEAQIDSANSPDDAKLYKDFSCQISPEKMYTRYSSPENLATKVSEALLDYKRKHGELGRRLAPFATWNEYFARWLNNELYFNHMHTLVGRRELLDALSTFVAGQKPIATLYGPGGTGKSKILLEFAQKFDEVHTGWKLRFLNDGYIWATDSERNLGADPTVIIIDDAHRNDQLDAILALQASSQYADRTKFILTARKSGKAKLDLVILRRFDISQLEDMGTVKPLQRSDVMELARNVLGNAAQEYADRLAHVSHDCPLVTVVGGRLIAEKKIGPDLLGREEIFRRIVLDRFQDELTTYLLDDSTKWKEFLQIIAATSPIRTADSTFRMKAAEFLNLKPWDVAQRLATLELHGLLLRRGGLVRILPDVLSDNILHRACVTETGNETGYAEAVFRHFAVTSAQNLLRNLAELQWRSTQTGGSPDLLTRIWQEIKKEFASGDNRAKLQILKIIEPAAAYQPDHVLEIVESVLQK